MHVCVARCRGRSRNGCEGASAPEHEWAPGAVHGVGVKPELGISDGSRFDTGSFGAGRFEPARTVATPTEQRMTRGRSRPLCAPQFLRLAERTMPRAAGPQTLLRDGSRELLTARTEACTGGSGRSRWRHRGREHLMALRIGAIRGARGAPFDARLTGWVLQRNVQLLREPYVRPRGRKAV